MVEGREDSGSHFLEPQTSVASTVSIDTDSRERLAGDSLNPRTFDDDTGSSSSDEECRHDQRADLQKMMSRRNFAVVDGIGLRHRIRSSSGLEPSVRSEFHGGSNGGGHGRRRSSMAVLPEANETPPVEQPQSNQVCERDRGVERDRER